MTYQVVDNKIQKVEEVVLEQYTIEEINNRIALFQAGIDEYTAKIAELNEMLAQGQDAGAMTNADYAASQIVNPPIKLEKTP